MNHKKRKQIQEHLHKVYARYTVEEVDNDYSLLTQGLPENSIRNRNGLINDENKPIRIAALLLERNIDKDESFEKQLVKSLKLLAKSKDAHKLNGEFPELFYNYDYIIKRKFYTKWPKNYQVHYKKAFDVLSNWNYYFLSSNRTFQPYKSTFYKAGIKKIIDLLSKEHDVEISRMDVKDSNSFTEILKEYLRQKNIIGHYNANEEQCAKSVSLIQILDSSLFKLREADNSTYHEFNIFWKIPENWKNGKYLALNSLGKVEDINPCYFTWHQTINIGEGLLPIFNVQNNTSAENFIRTIIETKESIENARNLLIEQIPETIEVSYQLLFLASYHKKHHFIRYDKEWRLIDKIRNDIINKASIKNEKFSQLAVLKRDIATQIKKYQPNILHICVHGEAQKGLVFETADGEFDFLKTSFFKETISVYEEDIELIVLNACHSIEISIGLSN